MTSPERRASGVNPGTGVEGAIVGGEIEEVITSVAVSVLFTVARK